MRSIRSVAGLAVAGLALTASVAGCSHPATSAESPDHSPSARPVAPAGDRSAAPATTAPAAAPVSSGPVLPDGHYADAADGVPHYILSLSLNGAAVRGSVMWIYQDGRRARITRYTGNLSARRKLTFRFGDGHELTGSYQRDRFTLADCTTVLPFAHQLATCQFSFSG